jgi:hypothetical protein
MVVFFKRSKIHIALAPSVTKCILKACQSGTAIVWEAEERAADMILIANHPARVRRSVQQMDPIVEYVIKNAPCEVLVLSQGQLGTFRIERGETEGKALVARPAP